MEGWQSRLWRLLLVHLHIVHTFGISMYSKRRVPASPAVHGTAGKSQMARGRQRFRDDSYGRSGLIQIGRLFIGIVVLLALGAGALAYYATTLTPERHKVEKVLPDDSFPH